MNTIRHHSVFDCGAFGDRSVTIIGAGATGSRIAWEIAKLGVENLRVFDFDVVESHNVPNQIFGEGDIGRSKVEALYDIILRDTGTAVQIENRRVDGTESFGDVVFLLVDDMDTRRAIWERGIRYNPSVKLLVETRMAAEYGRVYALNPCDPTDVAGWESTLYASSEAQPSACGATPSVGPTAGLIASFAVWQLINWFRYETGGTETPPVSEIMVGASPDPMISTLRWQ